jgi:ABC-type sulfate/molybdate transport systems ATPase subunit
MLEVQNICFSYGKTSIIQNISFEVQQGAILGVMGESGCGKSTLLQLIYGNLDNDSGQISWKGKKITGPKHNLVPGMSFMKYLSQHFDLMPYTSVAENVGTFLSNFYPEQKKARTDELLALVDMTEFTNTKVKFLSGGQMQRVALAKSLAVLPEVLLLDEPFSHIDHFRRNELRRSLFEFTQKNKITCIVATHDREDVLPYADTILVLRQGKLIQNQKPQFYLDRPTDFYCSALFGDCSWFENELGERQITFPHHWHISERGIKVTVVKCLFYGNYYLCEVKNSKNDFWIQSFNYLNAGTELTVNLSIRNPEITCDSE